MNLYLKETAIILPLLLNINVNNFINRKILPVITLSLLTIQMTVVRIGSASSRGDIWGYDISYKIHQASNRNFAL